MMRNALLAALGICMIGALTIAQQTPDQANSLTKLRSIGQAMQMYAVENKGYFPPDLASVQRYLPKDFQLADSIYLLKPGTKLTRLRGPATQPVAMSAIKGNTDAVAILFADGHAQAFEPARANQAGANGLRPAASTEPAMMEWGDATTPPPTRVMENPAKGIVGGWKVNISEFDAIYVFAADGAFTLTFTPTPRTQWNGPGRGRASGTWTLENNKLVMTNSASDTPFTVVGEKEEADVTGLDADALVLKTTDRKGKAEQCVLRRTVVFEKGKRDNEKIIGTWTARNGITLVLGGSGLAVLSPYKGEWSQRGQKLVINLEPRPPADAADGVRPGFRQRPAEQASRRELTIDFVDDTTLVLTGNLSMDPRANTEIAGTTTLLRAK